MTLAALLLSAACTPTAGDKPIPTDAPTADVCKAPKSGPTLHPASTLSADEVWTADASPHIVSGTLSVRAPLTIEPCAVVQLDAGANIEVRDAGILDAQGALGRPVTIGQKTAGARWSSISVSSPATAKLSYTDVSGGGDTNSDRASLSIVGPGTPTPVLFVDHVSVSDSKGYGISLTTQGAFADGSQELTVTTAGAADPTYQYPINISANAIGSLPTGVYTGNAIDMIEVRTDYVSTDNTIHDRGVPYMVGGVAGGSGDLSVGLTNAPSPTLTIEPNVEMHFTKDARFSIFGEVAPGASLVANATGAAPIKLLAADPGTPWGGVRFGTHISPTNLMQNVEIDHAGGASSASDHSCTQSHKDDAAILLFGQPTTAFITGCTISNSARNGICDGWDGSPLPMASFNTFVNIAGCDEAANPGPMHNCATPKLCP